MRVETQNNIEEAAASLSRLMDDFAAVSMHASGAPATGGYRVIHHAPRTPPRQQRQQRPRRARTPIRMTGTLAALLISSLGVAAFSGPATCPCEAPVATASLETPDTQDLARFAYARHNVTRAYRVVPLGEADLASLEARDASEAPSPQILDIVERAAAGEPVEASPISTAAIEPSAHHTSATGAPANARGNLFAERATELSEVHARPITLAAASPVEILPAASPEIEVATLPISDLTASEAQPEPQAEAVARTPVPTSRRHANSKHRSIRAYRSVVESRESKRKRLANIPPWAEKMFVPDWQSRAFNY